jgi:uncharacterized protein YbbC (DUF1343 family)/CubicO group peptidase (beta-lactamase class C family)
MKNLLKNAGLCRVLPHCLTVLFVGFYPLNLFAQASHAAPARTVRQQPASAAHNFEAVDAIVQEAVAKGKMPGAVVLVGHNGRIVYRKAFGWRSLEPAKEMMTVGTIFDLASLTKCIATATAITQLIERGQVRLNDPVAAYLPEFAQNGKGDITVRELMTHFSGLPPDLDLKSPWQGRDAAFALAMQEKPEFPPGTRFVYSDINFEILGFLVEKVSGMALNEYAHAHIFAPLRMHDTRFLPPSDWVARIAPTQYDEQGNMLRGVVHDPTARRMGGVAGHAGLFSTAGDLAKYAQALLSGNKILSRPAVEKMTTPQQPATAASLRGLGWDIDSPFSSNRGDLLPVGSFGHTGFTGTSLWIDPVTDTYIILLTNAVHPRGQGSVISLRSRVANAVATSLNLTVSERAKFRLARITGYNESTMANRRLRARNGNVKAGIDVLEAHAFRELRPNPERPVRVGLVTNQTALDAHGQRTMDVLARVPGIRVAAIFSPEHGVAGNLDTADIGNSRDAATGIPVYSVYGDTDAKRRPSQEQISSLDAIVYDIQDVGVRSYTYESTLGYFLESAQKSGKDLIVLDRPNPIGGGYVQGPIADAGRESFVSYWKTPVRHGMTVGELARMFNSERGIEAKLTVVPMEGWMRGDWYDSTGMTWINPSPNMRSLTEATLYPGIGMIEGTNISVGRGTDAPFELLGAPWVSSTTLAQYLNAREIGGVRFIPVNFTPDASIYAGQSCGGVNILLTDRDALDAPELGLEVASALHILYPGQYKLDALDGLMRNQATLDALVAGEDPRRIAEDWQDALETFEIVRSKYLLY